MPSSNKIRISEAVPEDGQISSLWGGVFFHPIFVRAGAEYLGLEGSTKTIQYNGNEIGISNMLFQKRTGIRVATIPLLFQYFGPLFYNPVYERDLLECVLRYYEATCDFIFFSLTPEFNAIECFGAGWNLMKATTLVITYKEFEFWGNNFRDDVRNKINKAKREKVHVVQSDTLNERLWELSFTRKGMTPPIKPSDLKRWCSDLMNGSLLRIYSAVVDDREVAFRGQLITGSFAYDWIAGSDPDFHHFGTNQLLMAETGADLRSKGVQIWDLVDGSVKGIADFKRSFGAVDYYHWHVSMARGLKGKLFGALRKIKNA